MNLNYLHNKILVLKRKHAVGDLTGPFKGSDSQLNDIETFIHELAHWVTLGKSLGDVSPHLASVVDNSLDGMSKFSSDSLEYDATMITYLTGLHLELWDHIPETFAKSCNKNLRLIPWLGTKIDAEQYTINEFTNRLNSHKSYYIGHAVAIASWLKPSCRKTFTRLVSFKPQSEVK